MQVKPGDWHVLEASQVSEVQAAPEISGRNASPSLTELVSNEI